MSLTRTFIRVNEYLYEIHRTFREDKKPNITNWNSFLGTDKAFKNDGYIYFCTIVE